MTLDTIIIGAGISGLLAGSTLQQNGRSVLLIDKGRQVGGRMATRRFSSIKGEDAVADHGAQFFTVREPQFQAWVDGWLEAGTVIEWCKGFSGRDGYPRYRGSKGMTSPAKMLAENLPVQTKTKVTQISHSVSGWLVKTEQGELITGKSLILTPPVPQSLALLDAGKVALSTTNRSDLDALSYDPCFAVMVLLNRPSHIPPPGGVQLRGEVIDWIGDNQQKGISVEPTVTIHASAGFTRQHLKSDRHEVTELLLHAAEKGGYFSKSDIVDTQIQRWMYAQPVDCYPERCLKTEVNGLPLVFAGDAFKHARVEGAALSGLAAAQSLLED